MCFGFVVKKCCAKFFVKIQGVSSGNLENRAYANTKTGAQTPKNVDLDSRKEPKVNTLYVYFTCNCQLVMSDWESLGT